MTLIDGIGGGGFQKKNIKIWGRPGVRNLVESEEKKRLHRPIGHTRNRKRTFPPSPTFGDIYPAQRLGAVPVLAQARYRSGFLLGRLPDDAIHPRRPFALIFRHSFD